MFQPSHMVSKPLNPLNIPITKLFALTYGKVVYLHVSSGNPRFEHALQRPKVVTSFSAYMCVAQAQQRTWRQSCCRRAR